MFTQQEFFGVNCSKCDYYQPIKFRILIIKLGAIGDVIRTTPLIEAFSKKHENIEFTWLTQFPDILPKEPYLKVYKWDYDGVTIAKSKTYDIALNLDKEDEACLLLKEVTAKEKYGFISDENHLAAATPNAEHKILTGCFDELSKANTKSYLEEIFEICHLNFSFEEYVIRKNQTLDQKWGANH